MSNNISVKEKDIIITDPCYIAKRGDWGSIFNYELYSIESPEFTNYIWTYTGQGDGSWMVSEMNDILNRAEMEKYIESYSDAIQKFKPGDINSVIKFSELAKKQKNISRFGVDSGTFGVFYLDEVLKYNPEFLRDHGVWLYTIIPGFTGSIQLQFREHGFNILGIGNKTFCSL